MSASTTGTDSLFFEIASSQPSSFLLDEFVKCRRQYFDDSKSLVTEYLFVIDSNDGRFGFPISVTKVEAHGIIAASRRPAELNEPAAQQEGPHEGIAKNGNAKFIQRMLGSDRKELNWSRDERRKQVASDQTPKRGRQFKGKLVLDCIQPFSAGAWNDLPMTPSARAAVGFSLRSPTRRRNILERHRFSFIFVDGGYKRIDTLVR
jgi:hypothetical protein